MTKGTFGLRLRGFRKKKGLTIEQMAERVGLSTNYLGDVERGKKTAQHGDFDPHRQRVGYFRR